jgi:starch synthase
MQIFHISAECYPAAKVGGLGDVLGALPKYLNKVGAKTSVIIPKYKQKWILEQTFERLFSGSIAYGDLQVPFFIDCLNGNSLGYPLFLIDIPQFFDREGIYTDVRTGHAYTDEPDRYVLFQQAALQFIQELPNRPDIIHCHDHHTGLIPFLIKHCEQFKDLQSIPTVFTIHNGQYNGAFSWNRSWILPEYDITQRGLLDWDHAINPLACGIKCSWKLSTVSNGYLQELNTSSNGLESLINKEMSKAIGIVNGIDSEVWNPQTDVRISKHFDGDYTAFKSHNKQSIAQRFAIQTDLPLITFIGRLVYEKGADCIPEAISSFLEQGGQASFVVLGTGDPDLRDVFMDMREKLWSYFDTSIEYNEDLAHQLYAGSDFLMMPSRVEPCGLNQLYAFRYGTIPIVRRTGGLADTVLDVSQAKGTGICYEEFSSENLCSSFHRAAELYKNKKNLNKVRKHIMSLNYSWEKASENYLVLYRNLTQS